MGITMYNREMKTVDIINFKGLELRMRSKLQSIIVKSYIKNQNVELKISDLDIEEKLKNKELILENIRSLNRKMSVFGVAFILSDGNIYAQEVSTSGGLNIYHVSTQVSQKTYGSFWGYSVSRSVQECFLSHDIKGKIFSLNDLETSALSGLLNAQKNESVDKEQFVSIREEFKNEKILIKTLKKMNKKLIKHTELTIGGDKKLLQFYIKKRDNYDEEKSNSDRRSIKILQKLRA